MRKISTYWAFFTLFLIADYATGQTAQKKVLVIYSFDATFHIYKKSEKALRDVFPYHDFLIDTEFLDSKQYPQRQLNQNVYDRIGIKQQAQFHYDIVIACNDNALNFCLEHQNELFKETPIVFWGVNDLKKAFAQNQNEWVTGIAENISVDNTLALIRKLHPNQNQLKVITDNTTTSIADYEVFLDKIRGFPDFKYQTINVSNYTLAEFTEELKQFHSNDIVLLLASYRFKDTYLGLEQIAELFTEKTDNIIYYTYDIGVGMGYMGRTIVDYYEHMHSACLIAKQILTGTSPKHLKVTLNKPTPNVIDFKELRKKKIDINSLPQDVILLNKPSEKIEITRLHLLRAGVILTILFLILLLIIYNINHLRKKEKSHRIFAESYLNIFNENHSMMLLIEASSQQIEDANKAAAKFYGYSQENLKHLSFNELCQFPQIDIDAFFVQSLKKNSYFEQKHKLKDGRIKNVEIHSGKMVINKTVFIYAIVHDISKRIQAEQELIEAKKRAEESDRLKSAFLANMSHEIRTPMNSILGFSTLLDEPDINESIRKEFVRHIHTSGEHLLTLINDIIDLSKIEANQLKISKTECNINNLLEDIYLIIKSQIDERSDAIELVLVKGIQKPDLIIKTDEVRLKQIFINLLNNALKFTDAGKIEFGYKYREDSVIQFFVKDTGIGIPANKQKDIFSAFQQIEEYATRNHEGTGLGLSITRSLVEKLGGHIWVMSEEGQGARFYFTHPSQSNKLKLELQS